MSEELAEKMREAWGTSGQAWPGYEESLSRIAASVAQSHYDTQLEELRAALNAWDSAKDYGAVIGAARRLLTPPETTDG